MKNLRSTDIYTLSKAVTALIILVVIIYMIAAAIIKEI